jgi:ribonucleoside-diphosphate reductase alpha chain
MEQDPFRNDVSRQIWLAKYRFAGAAGVASDQTMADSWRRVGLALAAGERDAALWQGRFQQILQGFQFLPGGRILAGAGTQRRVTLCNCFVMGAIADSMAGIFDALKEGAITMQQGGGVGYDFSTLRPMGEEARSGGTVASGPLSFMRIWDSMCATILSSGARRGAMMATLRCDHPDIERFIAAKSDPRELRHFNLSVLVNDGFMAALERDEDWPLIFPLHGADAHNFEVVMRHWPGETGPVPCKVYRRIPARQLWQQLMQGAYDYAEPGVLFIDRINRDNNLHYCEQISATNPCGEIPLPPYGACDLGAINLTQFVRYPFMAQAGMDLAALEESAAVATRLLDNVIDVSHFPLPQQAQQARAARRIGLGITGLADALIMVGLHYDSNAARQRAAEWMALITHSAYRTSIALAREKGVFPHFERDGYLASPFVMRLPLEIRDAIAAHGIRNSHLTAIAPTGTISLLANNVSSGLEPVFDFRVERRMLQADGSYQCFAVEDYAHALWRQLMGDAPLPDAFVPAAQLSPAAHLAMQAALQPYIDNAISKTINVAAGISMAEFAGIYQSAYRLGLKGCTTYRPNAVTGAILDALDAPGGCCGVGREAD